MTTAPLKTAARALSFATVVVAGFALWVVGQQALMPPQADEPQAVASATEPVESLKQGLSSSASIITQASPEETLAKPNSRPEPKVASQQISEKPLNEVTKREPQKSAPKPQIFFEADPVPVTVKSPSISQARKSVQALPADESPFKDQLEEELAVVAVTPRIRERALTSNASQASTIQPPQELVDSGENALSPAITNQLNDGDAEVTDSAAFDLDAVPSKPVARSGGKNVPAQRASRNKASENDSQKLLDDAASSRLESRLLTMQRQLDQFAQAQAEQKADELQQAREILDQLQRERDTDKLDKVLQDIKEMKEAKEQRANPKPDSVPPAPVAPLTPPARKSDDPFEVAPPADDPAPRSRTNGPSVLKAEPVAGHSDKFSIEFQDVEISKAMAMLGQLSGMNILIGRGVTGVVPTANLQDVTAEEALDAITKSLNYVYEKDGNIVFISTPSDSMQRKQSARKMVTKVFRPRYVSVKDLQTLVTPLLTKPGGLIAVTTPAEIGLEESKTKGGGNSLSQTDALLIVDYPEVLAQVETVITEIDVPPAQVVIEAMILSVNLTEKMKLGVNFALLGGNNNQLVTTGNGAQISGNVGFPNNAPGKSAILPAAGDFIANTAGLKYGFLTGDVAGFVEALETLADTSVVASPSVRVLNKQRAELIIGKRLGYTTTTFNGTQSIQNINFLEVGTKLILRPYVSDDGLVRMEIHPERSDGEVIDGLPNSRTTEVTSNVMVRDGTTIVIGGLIEEQATQSTSRVPGLGALPVVGNLFKSKSNDTQRTELIVLLTPRVIHEVETVCEGEEAQAESELRHEQFRNKMSKIGRTNLANIEYERAARKFEEGDYDKARFHIEQSLRQNRLDADALRLKEQIDSQIEDRNRWFRKPRRKPPVEYHRVPSSAAIPSGVLTSPPVTVPTTPSDAAFDQEFSIPTLAPNRPIPTQPFLIPPVPSAATDR